MNIKRWWFERSINPVHSSSHYYQDRKNQVIGIISDLENGLEDSKIIQKYFNKAGTNIYQLHYTQTPPIDNSYFFSNKETKWPGIPKGELVNVFMERQYDICFFLITKPSLPLEYLLRSVRSSLKIGFYHKEYEPFLDFALEITKEPTTEIMVKNLIREVDQLLFKV